MFQILKICVQTHCCNRKRTKIVWLNFNRIESPLVFTTYNLQFWLFFGRFLDFSELLIFSPIDISSKVNVTYEVARVLGTICVASKSLWTPHLFIYRETQNCLEINVNASTYSFQATCLLSNDLPCPYEASRGVQSSCPGKSPKACIITFNFGCFLDIFYFRMPGHIFSRNVFRSVDMTCNIARVLGTICVASKII